MSSSNEDLSHLRYAAGIVRQAGALCWHGSGADLRFALVTSRRTGRWVLPKGSIDPGMAPWEAAAQEALEEAGVVGVPEQTPLGTYRTAKIRPPLIWTVAVDLYPIRIDEVLDVWIEVEQRRRRFVTLAEARTLVGEGDGEMIGLIERFAARSAPF